MMKISSDYTLLLHSVPPANAEKSSNGRPPDSVLNKFKNVSNQPGQVKQTRQKGLKIAFEKRQSAMAGEGQPQQKGLKIAFEKRQSAMAGEGQPQQKGLKIAFEKRQSAMAGEGQPIKSA